MLNANVPPHITLTAFECEKEDELVQRLETHIYSLQPGTLHWVSVGAFLHGVIFLQPVLNEYLQELMQQVYDCLREIEGVKISPLYCPYSWLPHTTMAKKLEFAQLVQAFEVLQKEFSVFQGNVIRMGLAKMNPHKEII